MSERPPNYQLPTPAEDIDDRDSSKTLRSGRGALSQGTPSRSHIRETTQEESPRKERNPELATIKSDMDSIEIELGTIKGDMDSMKTELDSVKDQMKEGFKDQFEKLSELISGFGIKVNTVPKDQKKFEEKVTKQMDHADMTFEACKQEQKRETDNYKNEVSKDIEDQSKMTMDLQSANVTTNDIHSRIKLWNTELRNIFTKKYPALFTDFSLSKLKHDFKYNVKLTDFHYGDSVVRYSNARDEIALHDFIKGGIEYGILEAFDETEEKVALAPVFGVYQKNKVRIVIDFRKINQSLYYQSIPLKPVDLVISKLKNYKFFSLLDLKSAYHFVPITGDKIGIATNVGNFIFKRLPVGLASAPFVFEIFLKKILKRFRSDDEVYIDAYIDDIIIATKTAERHGKILDEVFKELDEKGLSISVSKSKLGEITLEYLGYEVGYNSYKPSQDKIEAIRNWAVPQSSNEFSQFVGFINYWKRFIPDCSITTASIYELISKHKDGNKFSNKPISAIPQKVLKDVAKLKQQVQTITCVHIFQQDKPIDIFTDASLTGVKAIIFQRSESMNKDVPIAFISREFNPTQQIYSTLEGELLGMIACLSQNYLLIGSDITIYTDHQALLSINNKTNQLSTRVMRFIETLSTYQVKLKYIKGSKITISDFLSRYGLENQKTVLQEWFEHSYQVSLHERTLCSVNIQISQFQESDFDQIKEYLMHKTDKIDERLAFHSECFAIQNNELYHIYENRLLLVVTAGELEEIGREIHKAFHSSPRILKQILLYEKGIWNPQLDLIVVDIVRQCATCDVYLRWKSVPPVLHDFKIYSAFECWHFGFIGPLIPSRFEGSTIACSYVLNIVDYATSLLTSFPCSNATTEVVIQAFRNLIAAFGVPKEIVTDNGVQFTSHAFNKFCEGWKLKIRRSSNYHLQANSRVERVNCLVKYVMYRLCRADKENWSNELYRAVHFLNNTKSIYGFSPRYLAFGRKYTTTPVKEKQLSTVKFSDREIDTFLYDLDSIHLAAFSREAAAEALEKIDVQRSHFIEQLQCLGSKYHSNNEFQIGELVLKLRQKRHKNEPIFEGPFIVINKTDKNSYTLKGKNGKHLPGTYHISHLRPAFQYYGSSLRSMFDYSRSKGEQERNYFISYWKDLLKFL
ncbi:hypothetical protein B5S33_g2629 [[Candida] boidinii]|nr:hypothetical protein B5S33_g2629 [[Candida] boidinii]